MIKIAGAIAIGRLRKGIAISVHDDNGEIFAMACLSEKTALEVAHEITEHCLAIINKSNRETYGAVCDG